MSWDRLELRSATMSRADLESDKTELNEDWSACRREATDWVIVVSVDVLSLSSGSVAVGVP
jgi:hypothetical protein